MLLLSTMTLTFNVLALLAVCATAAMHWVGVEHSLYWIYPWWHIPTHILGGLTVGLWAAAVSTRYKLPPRRAFFFVVGLALAVGVAWEVWEVFEGVGGGYGNYWLHTTIDVCDDMLGAFVAWIIYVLTKTSNNLDLK